MCIFHKWKFIGNHSAWHWLGGVPGGYKIKTTANFKQCEKCGKTIEVGE